MYLGKYYIINIGFISKTLNLILTGFCAWYFHNKVGRHPAWTYSSHNLC